MLNTRGTLTDISVVEWSTKINSDSSPLSSTETAFSPDSSSAETETKKRTDYVKLLLHTISAGHEKKNTCSKSFKGSTIYILSTGHRCCTCKPTVKGGNKKGKIKCQGSTLIMDYRRGYSIRRNFPELDPNAV